jgi:hypothetical protein
MTTPKRNKRAFVAKRIADAKAERENELAVALDAYTDPRSPEYDREFDKQIRALRPDWFSEQAVPPVGKDA